MKTILTFTLILTMLFPASIFACPNEMCADEGLKQRLFDEELLSEVMLIAEDGVVEKEELENLFILIEEKWGVTPSEFIDSNLVEITYNPLPTSCAQLFIFTYGYFQTLTFMCGLDPYLDGNLRNCLSFFFDGLVLLPIMTFIYCGYLFLIEDPILKILLFILDLYIEFPWR